MDCKVTYEELAGWKAGNLPAPRARWIKAHTVACATCRTRLNTLDQSDLLLRSLSVPGPAAGAILAARRRLTGVTQPVTTAEILTMEEAAEFLRLTPEQVGELIEELPAFELAGQIRIRRQKLLDWIEQRERGYTRQTVASWTVQSADWLAQKGVA